MTLAESDAICVVTRIWISAVTRELIWVAANAATCVVARDAIDVVERPATAVVESPAICLALSKETVKDICPSESTRCQSTSPGTEVSRIANVGSTLNAGDTHTQKLIAPNKCGDNTDDASAE